MKFRTLKYHIKEGLSGIFKNRLMSLAAIITVMACIFIFIISMCVIENISYILEQFESKIGITVFVKDEVSDKDLTEIEQQLKQLNHVNDVRYTSKEQALQKEKENFKDKKFLEGLEKDNPLPRSFYLAIDSSENQRAVIAEVETIQKNFEQQFATKIAENKFKAEVEVFTQDTENESVESATEEVTNTELSANSKDKNGISLEEYQKAEVSAIGSDDYEYKGIYKITAAHTAADSLAAIKNTLRLVGIILLLVMIIIAMEIIMNTIKLTVFVRRNEINIMKYVGATDRFIRGPFIVEGLVIGIVGAIIPCAVCWFFYDQIVNIIYNEFSLVHKLFELKTGSDIFVTVIPLAILLGGGIGALASITSIRKHLNV